MAAYILPGYEHMDGWHCGSTAIRNACRYVGVELSEPICFGLGAGAGFFFLKSDQFSPSRIFNGRSPALVPPFFRHLGLPAEWHASDEFDWPAMRACLDDGRPVILLADIYYLPYYRSATHFPGHVVLLAGYDDAASLAYLLLTFVWNPDYGGRRDWDLFAPSAFVYTLLAAYLLARQLGDRPESAGDGCTLARVARLLIAASALHTLAWIYYNTIPWPYS